MKGFFGIGLYQPKFSVNQGTLWRSAYQLGAAYIFVIGGNLKKQSSDTLKAYRHIPCHEYKDFDSFLEHSPIGASIVAVEMGGRDLPSFCHPRNCIYLLGREDTGLPPEVIDRCHQTIAIPSIRTESFNVSIAGSLVMYDRVSKSLTRSLEVAG